MPRRGSAPPFSPCPRLAHRVAALCAAAARARIVCPLRPTVRRHFASGSALPRLHRTLVRHACSSRCAAPSSPRANPSCDPSASNTDASVASCVASPVPTAAPRVRIVAATDRVVGLLRSTVRRHLASGSALARHHRTLVRHTCVPDAPSHRLPVPPHRAVHRHPPRRTCRPSRHAFGPDASRMRLPMVAPAARRAFASSTRVDRPRATTHALASATRLGPDRLHTCHMSLSTAEPLWLSHLTHRWCMPYFVLTYATLTTLKCAVLRLFVISRTPDMPGIVRPFWVTLIRQ